MDIKKYLLDQIKTYESLMRDLEEEPKQKESDKPKKQYKQKPNSILLDKINADIKNQKRFSNYYKSIKNGTPFVEEDDNIRLVNNNNNLDSSLENQFNFLMSKYVKDQTTLTNIQNNLTPEMLSELIHNWALYEPEIRRFKGQYVDSNLFLDKIRNMLLKNVNLKYPQTRNLNSVIDASREPDIEMQKVFEAKNRAVNVPISEIDKTITHNLQMIEDIINWIGNKSDCNRSFELSSIVQEQFKQFNIILERFEKLREELTTLSNNNQDNFDMLYTQMKGISTGEIYKVKNQKINDFINSTKQQSDSFRTFLIKFAVEDFNNKIENAINKDEFRKSFREYFKKKIDISLDNNFKELKLNKLYELTNDQIIIIIDEILPATVGDMTLKGNGLKGNGLKPTEKQIHKKYFIDTNKLNNNVLEVRYNKNRHLTNIKSQIIGNGVKNIIHNIINDDTMNEKEYHELTENEKHLIRTILNMLEKSHLIKNKDQEFNEKFQILLGSYNAGNNSEILKNQLRQYIIHAMKLGIIPRNTGNAMLLELSL